MVRRYTTRITTGIVLAVHLFISHGIAAEVKGYYRKDGTYVRPHHRDTANSTNKYNPNHTSGNTSNYGNTPVDSEFEQLQREHYAKNPPPPPKPKSDYDIFMDAFDKRKPRKPLDARGTGPAHEYRDGKGVLRDGAGHIVRSQTAVKHFRANNPCPSTGKTEGACPGYQVDHRIALKNGGADDPSNMRWLSIEEHQQKSAHE